MNGLVSAGDGYVVNGDIDFVPVEPRPQCHLVAELLFVKYQGDDIGSEWHFRISIDGDLWLGGPITIHNGTTEIIGQRVADVQEGTCGIPLNVGIIVKAREKDPVFDDRGQAILIVPVPCEREPTVRHVLVSVVVPERRFWLWDRWLPVRRTAVLLLLFRLTVVCKAP